MNFLLNEIIDFLIYCIPTMLFAMPMSCIQFVKIHKQNYDTKSYSYIIHHYYSEKGLKVFFRGIIPYTAMNGVSSGIYPFASLLILYTLPDNKFIFNIGEINIWPIVLASFLGIYAGIIETSFTIKLESKEILRNKFIEKTKMSVFSIYLPIFLRNTLYWLPACICDAIAESYGVSFSIITVLSLFLGFVAGFVTLPFDVYATRKFGEDERKYNINSFINDIKNIGSSKLFSGTLCRCIQIAMFTLATSISNNIKHTLITIGFMN